MATASLVPMPRAVFYGPDGSPLAGGFVYTYTPGGTVFKTTWQDAAETTPNSNPIVLSSDGSCLIYGSGAYQITVTDSLGNAVPAYSGLTSDAVSESGISQAMLPVVGAATTAVAGQLLGMPSVANIAALRAVTSATATSPLFVQGYNSPADGGEGIFEIKPSDTTTADNGGTIIVDASDNRWYRASSAGPLSVKWFGAKGDGTTDDSSAFAGTFAALPSTGGAVYAPAATYNLASPLAYTLPSDTASVVFAGDGSDLTALKFGATDGLTISYLGPKNSAHIRDLSILTSGTNNGNGLTLAQTATSIPDPANTALSDITNVNLHGADGTAAANYWTTGISVSGVSNVTYANVVVTGPAPLTGFYSTQGTGVSLAGTADVTGVVHNFIGCTFNYMNDGVVNGQFIQGVAISVCNFTSVSNGFVLPFGITGQDQVSISACQFNCGVNDIQFNSPTQGVSIVGNLIYVPQGAVGFSAQNLNQFMITGNEFAQLHPDTDTAGVGVDISSSFSGGGGIITGNVFFGLKTFGITLNAGTTGINVQSNSYTNCATNVGNAGTGNTIGGGSI